jgi:bifunctional UDP-N-acetylglucosamine pyrophosphorylase/glucosamine-1-phosphate N-acetyltransferase
LKNLIEIHNKNESLGSILSANIEDPSGYGRIVRDNDKFVKIVEHKDANEKELQIHEINSGIYLFDTKTLVEKINLIKDSNKQNEYYLTDIFEFIDKDKISTYNTQQTDEINGINTIKQLDELSKNKQ